MSKVLIDVLSTTRILGDQLLMFDNNINNTNDNVDADFRPDVIRAAIDNNVDSE